ncbi:MAG: hypothetical protein IKD24_02785 [Alistipes sp.]|nr:hypothetical protein [Alistipes sp.]
MKRLLLICVLITFISCGDMFIVETVTVGRAVSQYCKNGETLVVVPELPLKVDSVQYYWDKIYVETQTAMPFAYRNKLEDEDVGEHVLQYNVYYRSIDEVDSEQLHLYIVTRIIKVEE